MNLLPVAVAFLLMLCPVASAQQARPQPVAVTECESFAAREAAAPDPGTFEGGDVYIGLGGLLVLVLLVYLVWYVLSDGGRR